MTTPACKQCNYEFTYENNGVIVCPDCDYAWSPNATHEEQSEDAIVDANGNVLADGDNIIVIKDLKFKGGVVKMGTKVKNIKLVDGDHNIDCKIDGIGAMGLKSEFVKKA
ncbi:MAG: zinc ribbon domain-containing protein YjdM [Candidatus Absconditabacteria bacterium]|nr:zinc ribbon domain-containing protein YjdM [Candidatus Absconditabacteria bacterium]MDD3868652.1 zinc ribbon domain-containing protein YjdM [Candidatus Absconditabacteria bacterium]MDD4714497.1 zinc ribbon domain-containing protein YjdM [Candidatus Absconditabacteria bacterium]